MYGKAIEDGVANYFLKNPNKKEVPTIEELKNANILTPVKIKTHGEEIIKEIQK